MQHSAGARVHVLVLYSTRVLELALALVLCSGVGGHEYSSTRGLEVNDGRDRGSRCQSFSHPS